MRPTVEGQPPGAVLRGEPGKELEVEIGLSLSFADPISYLDIIQNGKVKHSVRLADFVHNKGRLPKLHFKQSGWFLVRAVTDLSDTYRLAMTAPVLRGNRLRPAGEQAGGPVLPRLGLSSGPGRST